VTTRRTAVPPAGAPLPRPALVALGLGVVAAAALALWQPLLGVGLALVAALLAALARLPIPRLATGLVVLTALAAVAGPNLAAPPAPWLFAFRVLVVLLGLGLVGYLLMDGRLVVPSALPRPAALLAAWILWSALSIGWADDALAALRWTAFLAMMAGLALAIAFLCREPRRVRMLLLALGAIFVVACLVAVGEIVTGLHLPTHRGVERQGLFGATSLFGNENNFATYLTLTLPFFAVLPLVTRDVRLAALGFAGSAVALLLVLTTGSKSALLSVGLVLIGLLVVVGRSREGRGRLAAGVGLATLAVLLVVPAALGVGPLGLSQRAVTKLDFGVLVAQVENRSGSGGVRASLLEEGLGLVESTHGLGVGAGNAETRVQSLQDFPGAANLHNWWLEVLVNGGIVGFVLYLALFLLLLRGTLRAASRRGGARAGGPDPAAGGDQPDALVRYLGLASGLALLGFVAGSLGPSTAIHFTPMWITIGLAMGTLVLARRGAPRAPEGAGA
jgi:teichuronic acid biosynthesis protein TuaE